MGVVDQLLHDLKMQIAPRSEPVIAEAVNASLGQSRSYRLAERRTDGSGEWIRTIALSGVMVAVLIGVQAYVSQHNATQEIQLTQVKSSPAQAPMLTLATTMVPWKLDHRLSLERLRQDATVEPEAATHVSLTPLIDVSEEPTSVEQHDGQGSHRIETSLASGEGPLLIDPPAAGRSVRATTDSQSLYRRAMEALEQGRDATSLSILSQLLKLDPHHLVARRMAISLAIEQHQPEQGLIWLNEGLSMHPEDAALRTLQAKQLSQAGDVVSAVDVLQSIEHPDADALGLKAGLLVKLGRHPLAASAYEQALKSNPDNATWWLGLGLSWQAQGQVSAAREAFARAYRLGQLGPDVQTWLEQQL